MTVHMRHIRAADLCSGGARRWFDSHGLDWSDFLTNGVEEDVLVALNDSLADRVVEVARKGQSDGRR